MKLRLAGIVNVTPDSFSDGGMFVTPQDAVDRVETLFTQGASVVDIGAESTRPNATLLEHEEEWLRLEPVLTALHRQIPHRMDRISVDTRHYQTALHALNLSVGWINDVTGFSDPRMIEAVRHSRCTLVVMHSLGVPANPQVTLPADHDVVQTVLGWMRAKHTQLEAAGIASSRMMFDPGIGFGKTSAQSLEIVRRAAEFKAIGTRVLFGHSRKSFLKSFASGDPADRDVLTAITSLYLAAQGVDYVRVHNVEANQAALRYWDTLQELK